MTGALRPDTPSWAKGTPRGGSWFALIACLGGCSGPGGPVTLEQRLDEATLACPAQNAADRAFDDQSAVATQQNLPVAIDTSRLNSTELGSVAFALEVAYDEVHPALDVDFALSRGPMGRVVIAALGDGESLVPSLDAERLQLGFDRYYACVREIPATRDELLAGVGGLGEAEPEVVAESSVKDAPRVLYQLGDRGVFIAETAGPDGTETEVILDGTRTDSALDFFAYDVDGRLTTRVLLPRVDAEEPVGAPSACLLCHRDIHTHRIDVIDPRTN